MYLPLLNDLSKGFVLKRAWQVQDEIKPLANAGRVQVAGGEGSFEDGRKQMKCTRSQLFELHRFW